MESGYISKCSTTNHNNKIYDLFASDDLYVKHLV